MDHILMLRFLHLASLGHPILQPNFGMSHSNETIFKKSWLGGKKSLQIAYAKGFQWDIF